MLFWILVDWQFKTVLANNSFLSYNNTKLTKTLAFLVYILSLQSAKIFVLLQLIKGTLM